MKKLILTLSCAVLTSGAFGQGLVNFINQAGTVFTINGATNAAPASTYRFALFTAPQGTTDASLFTLAGGGIYATNQATAGRLFGGNGLVVSGWAAGQTLSFLVRGWETSVGTTWAQVSGNYNAAAGTWSGPGAFGQSAIAVGAAGGFDGVGTVPNLNLFGGAGLGQMNLVVPEPSSMALAGLGAAALMIFRRRK